MKIKSIQWKDHKVLGNLKLDFCNPESGSVYNTIILAGENGSGKTTVFETLTKFLTGGSFAPFESIVYDLDGNTYTDFRQEGLGVGSGYHGRRDDTTGKIERITTYKTSSPNNRSDFRGDKADVRYYGCTYSRARSGFSTKPIKSTTTSRLDSDKYEIDAADDYTSIKQLLIDMRNRDANNLINRRDAGEMDLADPSKDENIARFKNAFNNFYDNLRYKSSSDQNDELNVVFEKYGKEVYIDNLSTGEKQIAYRGAYLLRNMNCINGGVAIVDEPELGMHPKWQERSLQYYRDLFTPEGGEQTVQMFFATHSEYVIRAAMQDRDNVLIILLKNNNGVIEAEKITQSFIFDTVTAAEANYLVFDIPSLEYLNQLYGYLKGKHHFSVVQCDDWIKTQPAYDKTRHEKMDTGGRTPAPVALPTYVRNAMHHPESKRVYTDEEVRESIELLIKLCR